MKKIIVSFTFLFSTNLAFAQTRMYVNKKDGSKIEYVISEIENVSFDDEPVPVSHEYVDLGLPSGTLWATYNLGATSPEEYGYYFAWGNTNPMTVDKDTVYKFYEYNEKGGVISISKYNLDSRFGKIDGIKILEQKDDAATVNWGNECRMPTKEEQEELIENCKWSWLMYNGVKGCKVTGTNGKWIFLPAAGCRLGKTLFGEGFFANYWSSSVYGNQSEYCSYGLFFNSYEPAAMNDLYRHYGRSVRPVRSKE